VIIRMLLASAAFALAACSSPAQDMQAPPAGSVAAGGAVVDAPDQNARVASPLRVSGTAPADWFFENQFPARLVDAQGNDIAQAPAYPRVNWTEPGPKGFDAELTFSVAAETPATLVLQEDMPGENAEPREVRIPVVLVPGP
jgi:hypothetical protein